MPAMSGSGNFSSEPHIVGSPNEYPLATPPNDGISDIAFSPVSGSRDLLVSSWDATVRLYDVGTSASQNFQKLTYSHTTPVLCTAFVDGGKAASAGLDCTLKLYDIQAMQERVIGNHDKPIRCLQMDLVRGALVTGSWDSTCRVWDPRAGQSVATLVQPERVYSLSVTGNRLIVGTAGRKVWIWDMRQPSGPEQKRDSSLKFQTRSIRAMPDGQGFVVSSIEGRVAVEYMEEVDQRRKYAFKCHRLKEGGVEQVYPVNAVAFHPGYGTFATGGSDALVNIWDPANKKRLCQFHKYPASISALSFSADGSLLAMASSYQYELPADPNPIPKDNIFIRKVTDQETRPKN